jgi:hypothetical protein
VSLRGFGARVRIVRLREDGAVRGEPLEASRQLRFVPVQVIRAHLIDDGEHDEPRGLDRRLARGSRPRRHEGGDENSRNTDSNETHNPPVVSDVRRAVSEVLFDPHQLIVFGKSESRGTHRSPAFQELK